MSECRCCGTIHYDDYCLFCEFRREELLERLEPDRKAVAFSEIAAQGMFIGDRKRLRQVKAKGDARCPS
jgi:hypothetical protein